MEKPTLILLSFIISGFCCVAKDRYADSLRLKEIVVTARESRAGSTASLIDREAMQHLQPSSFADILELLPGSTAVDPDMGKANTIVLRQTGAVDALGNKTALSDDYAVASLGTAFVVDGAPVVTDASMATVPDALPGSAEGRRTTLNRGVDIRSIATDNIEHVEIVRGIPSAEYGNITSGVVSIRRTSRPTPLTARFKADGYSKLLSVGKGFGIAGKGVMNADLGWLDAKPDPRNSLESYRRLTASVRYKSNLQATGDYGFRLSLAADVTSTIDDAKTDPDLSHGSIDEYRGNHTRSALSSEFSLSFHTLPWLQSLRLNVSVSLERDITERRRQVAPLRASVAPTSMEEGVHDGIYLQGEYIADYRCESLPLSAFARLRASGGTLTGTMRHAYKCGIEWTMAKNYGDGQLYDLTRPLSGGWTTRPRAYDEVPALHTLSFFLEDGASAAISEHRLQVQAGLRGTSLPSLSPRYEMAKKVYVDPRINLTWTFPAFSVAGKDSSVALSCAWGIASRMPTADYLYPQVHYADMVQLNYYNTADPANGSRVSLRTYIEDATGYGLRPARNRKSEARLDFDLGRNRLSVTFFSERMRDGFRYSRTYTPRTFTRYDASAITPGIDPVTLDLATLPSETVTVLDGMSKVENGTRIDTRGVEFQLVTARWRPLCTSLTVSGAWFRTVYSNSGMLCIPVSDVVGDRPVSDYYVGLYDTDDGRVNTRFNTNFTFDTQVLPHALTFTTSIQCMWMISTRRLPLGGTPSQYLATDGQLHPYTAASAADPMLRHLTVSHPDSQFREQTVPTAIYVNLKATKKIGGILSVSAFVNRLFNYLPSYRVGDVTVRRASDAYFGMEATLTI